MLERRDLARLVYDAGYQTGKFTLRSGEVASEYWDKYKLFQPDLLPAICNELSRFIPGPTEVLAGTALGGALLAATLSYSTGLPAAYLRQEEKQYGTRKIIEGADVRGKNVCIIEDVVTTGLTVIETAVRLRKQGAIANSAICVILRKQEVIENIKDAFIDQFQYLFDAEELKRLYDDI